MPERLGLIPFRTITMNRGSTFAKTSKKDTQTSDRKSKAFKDISKYFSKEKWEVMGYSEQVTYVYMKRNFDAINNLGLNASTPSFIHSNRWTPKLDNSDNEENQEEPPQMASSVQQSKYLEMKSKKT
ncbi:PREDICTED: protein SSX8-like [Chrysochloris asiatica]|uniref:Protein SSX8-like n=1 Tax=Chrysochloris asiatica TaxID=185453 RepID=A0A9B0WQU7_CHRAS|nr:PREDICTED: protein SSX8-like [Chrysochloris asiatica]